MKTRALAMPQYVANAVRMPLVRMGLQPSEAQDDLVSCPLEYEDGTVLSLILMCIAKRRGNVPSRVEIRSAGVAV